MGSKAVRWLLLALLALLLYRRAEAHRKKRHADWDGGERMMGGDGPVDQRKRGTLNSIRFQQQRLDIGLQQQQQHQLDRRAAKGGAAASAVSSAVSAKGGSSAGGGSSGNTFSSASSAPTGGTSGAAAKSSSASSAKSSSSTAKSSSSAAKSSSSTGTSSMPPTQPPRMGIDLEASPTDRGRSYSIVGKYPSLQAMNPALAGDTQKAGASTYSYYRSDYDRSSDFYIPPSVRHRWRVMQPSRFEVGAPLPQDGFQPGAGIGSDSGSGSGSAFTAEALAQQHTLQGMPRDYFPNPLDPPMYVATKAEGAFAGN